MNKLALGLVGLLTVVNAAQAETTVVDINATITEGSGPFFLDANDDGVDDLRFDFRDGTPYVEGLSSDPFIDLPNVQAAGTEERVGPAFASFTNVFVDFEGDLTLFAPGQAVGEREIFEMVRLSDEKRVPLLTASSADLDSIFPEGGNIGFVIEIQFDPFDFLSLPREFDEMNDPYYYGMGETIFGFVNVSQGSILVNSVGTATANTPALVPAVPLPAGVVLLGGALAGLGSVARRRARR